MYPSLIVFWDYAGAYDEPEKDSSAVEYFPPFDEDKPKGYLPSYCYMLIL